MTTPKNNHPPSSRHQLQKNLLWNIIGSTAYAVTSLCFLVIATRLNGVDDAGVFAFAFSNACVFQVIGTYAGRSYQVTEKHPSLNNDAYFYNRLLSTIAMMLLGGVYTLVGGFTGLKFSLVLILIIYRALDAFTEVLYGIIQKANRLDQVGISLCLKGVFSVLAFLIVDLFTHNLTLASASLIVVSTIIMLIYDFPKTFQTGYRIRRINWRNSLVIFQLGFFTFLFTLLTQYLINSPKYAIDQTASADVQTIYGIIAMPATVLILAANFLVQPFLLQIKSLVGKQSVSKINRLAAKLTFFVVGVGCIGTILGLLLGQPVFQILYGVDTADYLGGLAVIIIGATIFGITLILSNILIAMRHTASQAIIFLLVSLVAFFLSPPLVSQMGVMGGAWSYFGVMSLLLVLYLGVYFYSLNQFSLNATDAEDANDH